jgi:hypothetical protein
MIGLFCFVLAVLALPFKSKLRLEAENAVLRHQLIVLRRRLHGRVRLTNHDRWFFIQLYRWFPSILQVSHDYPARDAGALASAWLSPLLAVEVVPIGRATSDRDGAARADPADEHRKSASLIGRLGSSIFRLSTTTVSMSLAGSCFSSESAPRPFQYGIRR